MLNIDSALPTPPYEQIKRQITAQRDSGQLPTGTRLPTVRRLAGDLGLAPNTVARAYKELEQEGVVQTMGRKGTVIANASSVTVSATAASDRFAAEMRNQGISLERAIALLAASYAAISPPPSN